MVGSNCVMWFVFIISRCLVLVCVRYEVVSVDVVVVWCLVIWLLLICVNGVLVCVLNSR